MAELHALNEALNFIERLVISRDLPQIIRICTDSPSALTRLKDDPSNQTKALLDEIWTHLSEIGRTHRVDLQWVPGHAGVAGNEIADGISGEAANLPQGQVPINLYAAKARLKLHLGREWGESNRHSRHFDAVGPGRIRMADKLGLSREEGVALARLRTDESPMLRAWRHKVGLEDDPNCTACDDGEPEDVEHLLMRCLAAARLRRDIFGRDDPTLREAFANPVGVVAFPRYGLHPRARGSTTTIQSYTHNPRIASRWHNTHRHWKVVIRPHATIHLLYYADAILHYTFSIPAIRTTVGPVAAPPTLEAASVAAVVHAILALNRAVRAGLRVVLGPVLTGSVLVVRRAAAAAAGLERAVPAV